MRNIAPTGMSSLDGLSKAGAGLHREVKNDDGTVSDSLKYVAYHAKKEVLEIAYSEYDSHTSPCRLEEIVPLPLSAHHESGLKDLYSRQRSFIKHFWNEVAYDNGEYIMCPLCGQKVVADLDHYIPRSKMSEYSVHLLNLIPVCHECNDHKGELWLGSDNKRLIFNAYFDRLESVSELISASIVIDVDISYPRVELSLDEGAIASRGDVGRLVASTYNSIRSIREQWKSKASSVLKSQIRHILSSMKTRRNRGLYTEGDWGFERETMQENILSLSSHEFIEKVVCEKMLTSKAFSDWIVEEFKKL